MVFPGTGHAPGTFSPFSIVDPTFGPRLANTVSGYGYGPQSYGNGYGYGTGAVVAPYAVPVYVPYPEPVPVALPPPPPPPQIIYIVPSSPERSMTTTAPPPQHPGVVTYVVPPRETPRETQAAPASAQRLYLIAFQSQSIYTAVEYWLEGDTLHYRTPQGAHNQATLDQIDVELTVRLNRERGIDIRIP